MLTVLLVWVVALGSLSIFLAGMIFPELSRKNDLIWVGVGLFYALILWANKGTMGGGLLLGQTAGVSMMIWLGWQAMTQRRELTAPDKKTPVPDWLQKIIDVVTPLWQKAYGAIAGQLGLDAATDEVASGDSEDALSGLKSKAMGFLDKLNNKPEETVSTPVATEDETTVATDDLEDDWDEDEEDAADEAIASESEAPVETESEAEAVAEDEPVAVEEAPTATVETPEPEAPVVEPPHVAVVEPAPEEPVADVSQEESPGEADQPQSEAPAVAAESEPVVEVVTQEPEVVEEPQPTTDPESASPSPESHANNAPEDGGAENEPVSESEPASEEAPQEESNWPPEPMD